MTFNEIVDDLEENLHLTSSTATTRLGREVNKQYKKVTSALGLTTGRRTEVQTTVTIGVREVIFSGVEKVLAVVDKSSGTNRYLIEESYDYVNDNAAGTESPRYFAVSRMGAKTVTIYLDCVPQTAFVLYAEGLETKSTLSGTDEPAFSESYHDILIYGVMEAEYRKLEKFDFMRDARNEYETRMGELRLWIAKSSHQDIVQGKHGPSRWSSGGVSGGSGGVAPDGAASWTQTGLITFDRDPATPFAVTADSAAVDNLKLSTPWVTVAHSAGDYTASTGSWLVAVGDLTQFKYQIIGKTVFLHIKIDTSTVTDAPLSLRVAMPAAFTFATLLDFAPVAYALDNITVRAALAMPLSASILSFQLNTGSWATTTNSTFIYFSGFFEIA